MRGIRHKELLEIDPWQYDNQQDLLNHIIEQCKELNTWMTLEEFLKSGFVGKCWVLAVNDTVNEAIYSNNEFNDVAAPIYYYNHDRIKRVMPIRKPEPGDKNV